MDNLAEGRARRMSIEFSSMPRNVIRGEGPSTLSGAIGTPSSAQVDRVRWRASWHSAEPGAPRRRKSSK